MNKTALVFGASSGIGLAVAKKLRTKGYEVFNASRTDCPETDVIDIVTDVTDGEAVENAVAVATQGGGPLDVLVYSAGYSMAAPIEHAREDDYRYLFETNFFGALKAMQAAIPVMRAQGGGRIILISSMGGEMPIPFDSFYSCSKAALDMLSAAANIELDPYNVKVTSLRPGGTKTRFTFKRNVYPDELVGTYAQDMMKATVALAKMEQGGDSPEDVAETAIKLLEAENPPQIVASGFKNKAAAGLSKILPESLVSYLNKTQYLQ